MVIRKMPYFLPENKSSFTLTKNKNRMLLQYCIAREFLSAGLAGSQLYMLIYGVGALVRFRFSILKKWEIVRLNMSMIKKIIPEIAAKRLNEFIIILPLT